MEKYIKRIDEATDVLLILNHVCDAMKIWLDSELTSKEFGYIKGYADCKIKQLKK